MHDLSGFMRVFDTPVDGYGPFFVLAHDDAGVRATYKAPPAGQFSWSDAAGHICDIMILTLSHGSFL
jgi:hypothetical protein